MKKCLIQSNLGRDSTMESKVLHCFPTENNRSLSRKPRRLLLLPVMHVFILLFCGCSEMAEDVVIFDFYENVPTSQMETYRRDGRGAQRWSLNLQMDMRDFIYQPSGTRLTWYLTIPKDSILRFGAGMDMISWQKSRGVTLSIIITPENGVPDKVFSLLINPQINKKQAGWIDRQISLKQFTDQRVRIEFLSRSYSNPEDDARIGWSRPLITQRRNPMDVRTASRWEYNRREHGESIYWIIANSMEPNKIGAYGVPEVRTPWIDRFSRSSVQIEGCVPPAMQYFRSVASMVTGQFSISHGITQKNRSYQTGVKTLATILRKSRYTHTSLVLSDSRLTTTPFAIVPDASENYYVHPRDECDTDRQNERLINFLSRWSDNHRDKPHLVILLDANMSQPSTGPHLSRLSNHDDRNSHASRLAYETNEIDSSMIHQMVPNEFMLNDQFFGQSLINIRRTDHGRNSVIIFSSLPSKPGREELQPDQAYSSTALENISAALMFFLPRLSHRHQLISGYASGLDIVPTLLDYLGVENLGPCDGKTLLPFFHKGKTSLTPHSAYIDHLPGKACMLSWPYKVDYNRKGTSSEYLLFNIEQDPHEQHAIPINFSYQSLELCQQFRTYLILRLEMEQEKQKRERHSSHWFPNNKDF